MKRRPWTLLLFGLLLAGCTSDKPAIDPLVNCQTYGCGGSVAIATTVQGLVANLGEGGAYCWSALFRDGQFYKGGTPRFIASGPFGPLDLMMDFEPGEIPDGRYEVFVFTNTTLASAANHEFHQRYQQGGPLYLTVTGGIPEPTCPLPIENVAVGANQRFYAYIYSPQPEFVQVYGSPQTGRTPIAVNWYLVEDLEPGRAPRAKKISGFDVVVPTFRIS